MEPAYERGNILLVNPSAQPEPGDDVVFMREDKDGQRYVLIKRLVKVNAAKLDGEAVQSGQDLHPVAQGVEQGASGDRQVQPGELKP